MSDAAHESNDAWSRFKEFIVKLGEFLGNGDTWRAVASMEPLMNSASYLAQRNPTSEDEAIAEGRRLFTFQQRKLLIKSLEKHVRDSPPVNNAPFQICRPSRSVIFDSAGDLWLEIGDDGLDVLIKHVTSPTYTSESLTDFSSRVKNALLVAKGKTAYELSMQKLDVFFERLMPQLDVVSIINNRSYKYPMREHSEADLKGPIMGEFYLVVDSVLADSPLPAQSFKNERGLA